MRRHFVFAVAMTLFFLAGRFCSELAVHADGDGVGAACAGNGDVNGDGDRDMTDAIYLLSWLFLGTSDPVACAEGSGLTPEQAEVLSHFSIVRLPDGKGNTTKTIRLTGVNLQIVNGTGETDGQNGVGNLIVGYNEPRSLPFPAVDDRTGSQDIVPGQLFPRVVAWRANHAMQQA